MKKVNIPISELDFTYSRSSGAGGQNVNKVNSKVTLHWSLERNRNLPESLKERFRKKFPRRINDGGLVVITSQRFRHQARNVADTIEKLHEMLEKVATPPKVRKKSKPSKSAIEKRLQNKKKQSDKKSSRRLVDDQ